MFPAAVACLRSAAAIGSVFLLLIPSAAPVMGTTPPTPPFTPGNLLLSRSVYEGTASTVTVGQQLPPICPATADCLARAIADGTYPTVFNNATPDGSFGVTSPIFIDQITTGGSTLSTCAIDPTRIVTSFSSKSELALNLSLDGNFVTFMGYVSPTTGSSLINILDVSNSNTPGVVDPTNPVGSDYYRAIARIDKNCDLNITDTNACNGNNGRAAIYDPPGTGLYYTVGNSNNGTGTPANVVAAGGVQIATPGQSGTTPPEKAGSFSITQITDPATGEPYKADKLGKDDNYRGLTIFNHTLYIDKGSGSNGINTVYQVGTTGVLPTAGGNPINILPGFPETLAKAAGAQNPFGLFFANANTLYVADEGDGAAADVLSPDNGLQKWVLENGAWTRVYVLQNGLNLGQQYTVPGTPAYPPVAPDGLRNITGRVNSDGTVTIWAITSTISTSGDQGADPNQLVRITDVLANTSPAVAANEKFALLRTATYGEVLRGVSFTPGTTAPAAPVELPVTVSGLVFNRRTQDFNGTVTVLNNTASSVAGEIEVLFTNLPTGVTLVSPVIAVPTNSSLGAGQSVKVPVSFHDPSMVAVTFTATAVQVP